MVKSLLGMIMKKQAGRPKLPDGEVRVKTNITLPAKLLEKVELSGKKSDIIEIALLNYFKNLTRRGVK